jgi:FkbM family methyltransferase
MERTIDGYTIEYPDHDGDRFITDIFQKGEYQPVLDKTNIVLDIGAHVGTFSFWIYKYAKRIWAVEPNPDNFDFLMKNIARNKLTRITPVHAGLWFETGEKYFQKAGSSGGGIITDSGTVPVKVFSLPDFVKEYRLPRIDIIKCDTEGAEQNIFCNDDCIDIVKGVNAVVMEHGNERVHQFFRELGFEVERYGRGLTVCRKP